MHYLTSGDPAHNPSRYLTAMCRAAIGNGTEDMEKVTCEYCLRLINNTKPKRDTVPMEILESIQTWIEQVDDPTELTQLEKNILNLCKRWTSEN